LPANQYRLVFEPGEMRQVLILKRPIFVRPNGAIEEPQFDWVNNIRRPTLSSQLEGADVHLFACPHAQNMPASNYSFGPGAVMAREGSSPLYIDTSALPPEYTIIGQE
jgi:hypothetical protein